jgi:hypothetical protein
MLSPYPLSEDKTAWLPAIGQRLRVEYDAVLEPMPPRLTALLDELRTIDGEAVHGREEEEGKTLVRRAGRYAQAAVVNSATPVYQT